MQAKINLFSKTNSNLKWSNRRIKRETLLWIGVEYTTQKYLEFVLEHYNCLRAELWTISFMLLCLNQHVSLPDKSDFVFLAFDCDENPFLVRRNVAGASDDLTRSQHPPPRLIGLTKPSDFPNRGNGFSVQTLAFKVMLCCNSQIYNVGTGLIWGQTSDLQGSNSLIRYRRSQFLTEEVLRFVPPCFVRARWLIPWERGKERFGSFVGQTQGSDLGAWHRGPCSHLVLKSFLSDLSSAPQVHVFPPGINMCLHGLF